MKKAVFLWLYCMDAKPYEKYVDNNVLDKLQHIPTILTTLRWDGSFGTIGGKVEYGESDMHTISREAFEEIGFVLFEHIPVTDIKKLSILTSGEYEITAYCAETSIDTLKEIRSNFRNAEHADSEVVGVNLVHATKYDGGKGINLFLQNCFCGTGRAEFEKLLERIESASHRI